MEHPLSLYRPGLGSNVSSVWCMAPCIIVSLLEKAPIALYICAVYMPLLHIHAPFLCLHCINIRDNLIHTLQTLTMGIPVLLNPFGAERLTRQRFLNAVQQTDDYIMSQQVLYIDSLNTCNQDTALFPMSRMPHVICLSKPCCKW